MSYEIFLNSKENVFFFEIKIFIFSTSTTQRNGHYNAHKISIELTLKDGETGEKYLFLLLKQGALFSQKKAEWSGKTHRKKNLCLF